MPWIGKYLIWVGSLCFPELRRPWKLELTVKAGKNFEVWSWKANLIKQNLSSSSPCAEKQNFQHFWRVSLNVAVLKSHLSFRNLEASSSTLLDLKSTYLQNKCDQIVWFIAIWATFQSIWLPKALKSCPNLPHYLAIFVKVSKSIIFLVKHFLGNFYRHMAIFSGHTGFWSCDMF